MRTTTSKPQTPTMQPVSVDQLTVWRHVQEGSNYKLSWYVELIEDKPVHIACSVEYGTESQRAVLETYVLIANQQLSQSGILGVVQLGASARSGYFEGNSPIDEFTTAFATTFLAPAEQAQLGLKNRDSTSQTDLLQSIEAVACEHCGNPVQQFGNYGICLHCGDAQIVKN